MLRVAHVMCNVSHVTCHMSHVTIRIVNFFFLFLNLPIFSDNLVELVDGGSVTMGPTPSSFHSILVYLSLATATVTNTLKCQKHKTVIKLSGKMALNVM